MLRAVQGWRRVTALGRASGACVRLMVPRVERKRSIFVVPMRSWSFVAPAWQKVSAGSSPTRAFKKVVSYRLIPLIFARLVLPPPLSFATAVAHGSSSWFG